MSFERSNVYYAIKGVNVPWLHSHYNSISYSTSLGRKQDAGVCFLHKEKCLSRIHIQKQSCFKCLKSSVIVISCITLQSNSPFCQSGELFLWVQRSPSIIFPSLPSFNPPKEAKCKRSLILRGSLLFCPDLENALHPCWHNWSIFHMNTRSSP